MKNKQSLPLGQQGYVIQIVLVAFALLIGLMIFPEKFPQSSQPSQLAQSSGKECVAGQPGTGEVLHMPAVRKPDPNIDYIGQGIEFDGGPDQTKSVDFVMIRSRVPIINMDKWKNPNLNWVFFDGGHTLRANIAVPGKSEFQIYYPGRGGGVLTNLGDFSIHNEGLIFFRYSDPKTITGEGANLAYLADVYQEKEIFNDPKKKYTTEELFSCVPGKGVESTNSVVVPAQNVSKTKDQLQLEWFLFEKEGGGPWAVHCKPAIYLYPSEKMMVNVKVSPSGYLLYTDPPYDSEKGWTVEANPDGKLTALSSQLAAFSRTYDYLYFESKIRDEVINKPTKGWVVKYDQLTKLYQEILPKLGLNKQQENDFIEYWTKALSKDPSPYYFVGVIDQKNVDQIERLDITPKPDSVNRVRIYFERLDQSKQVEAPELSAVSYQTSANSEKADSRELKADSFNVVEWGGMVKNDKDHPFTCSQ